MSRMRVLVVDGQGGGIGRALVEQVRRLHGAAVHIVALGTNALATAAMLKAGADEGATGENAIVVNAGRADAILGPAGIIAADSMLGELTAAMAAAIARSPARKILIPLNRCGLEFAGQRQAPFAETLEEAAALLGSPGTGSRPEQ